MSDAYELVNLGTDSSGRKILLNRRMKAAYDEVCDRIGFDPVITQGAYMARVGGGADASAGYHDRGGCIDTRTWDIDSHEERAVIHAARNTGWAVWRRDQAHGGFDEHMHWVLLGDKEAAPGALGQMQSYRNGGDGMGGSDYHWRPDPIPTFNYAKWLEETDMPSANELWAVEIGEKDDQKSARERLRIASNQADRAAAGIDDLKKMVENLRAGSFERDQADEKRDEALRRAITRTETALARGATKEDLSAVHTDLRELATAIGIDI